MAAERRSWLRFSRIELAIVAAVVLGFAVFAGGRGPAYYLLLGWLEFARANLAQAHWNGALVAEAIVCAALLAAGAHGFLSWLRREAGGEPWRWRWTLAGLGVVFLLFVAGIGTIGLTHQAAWLYSYDGPRTVYGWGEPPAVTEAIDAGRAVADRVAKHYASAGAMPPAAEHPGPAGSYRPVEAIEQRADGTVVVRLKRAVAGGDDTITFTPSLYDGRTVWVCSSTLPKRSLPHYCRG